MDEDILLSMTRTKIQLFLKSQELRLKENEKKVKKYKLKGFKNDDLNLT